eukprot:CAMPEP_0180176724 /NCGR_PEP_ID=MMETSP0986-20121125/37443_1 /TAXON_ID=697907 /ORGANISM="non described non described, Strain CCMP2293" /LENGTH=107 /DNA_ID=CAMNT_0022129361 /DNA_START=163 /DNA_END=487 /DNA_ORIENTATION=+
MSDVHARDSPVRFPNPPQAQLLGRNEGRNRVGWRQQVRSKLRAPPKQAPVLHLGGHEDTVRAQVQEVIQTTVLYTTRSPSVAALSIGTSPETPSSTADSEQAPTGRK